MTSLNRSDAAKWAAFNCVRNNTVLEDLHAEGKITDAEMKEFMIEVTDNLFAFMEGKMPGSTPPAYWREPSVPPEYEAMYAENHHTMRESLRRAPITEMIRNQRAALLESMRTYAWMSGAAWAARANLSEPMALALLSNLHREGAVDRQAGSTLALHQWRLKTA